MDQGTGRAIAERVMQVMSDSGAEPTPENYQLFYRYCTTQDRDFIAAVDSLMKHPGTATEQDWQRVRARFFQTPPASQLSQLYDKTQSHLQRLSAHIETAGNDARQYRNALHDGNNVLQGDVDSITQRELMERLIAATSLMIEKTERLEREVSAAGREIMALRQDLEATRREAHTDPLTSLPNRKAFQTFLEMQATQARGGMPLSLIFCDIDRFKLFNDTWGHRLGDEVLRLVGTSLEHLCQGVGFPARYGGEEFIIALPGKDLEAATTIAEQIRVFVGSRTLRVKNQNRPVGQITLSMGVAQFRKQDMLDDFIERADASLYRAKELGRNRVCTEVDFETAPTRMAMGL